MFSFCRRFFFIIYVQNRLNKKKDEYDELIRRCKQTQAGYEELNKEMSQMMSDYKRDMMEVMKMNARKVFGGKRK